MQKKNGKRKPPKPPELDDLNRVLPKRGSEKFTVTSIRIRDELLDKVATIAKKQGYTRNETLVRLIDWACSAFFQEELRNEADEKPKDVK
jgi:hypothetical protein